MNKKKILILMLVSLFLINIFAVVVRADPPVNGGAGIIDVIKDSATLKYLAVDFVEGIKQTPPAKEAVIVAKFLAVVLITLVLYQLISLVPTLKEWNKNSRIGLAVLIALIAGIATPTEYLKKIIVGAGYFVVLIPLVIILVLCSYGLFKWTEGKDRTDYIWRSIITVIIVYVLTTISTLLTGMELQEWGMTGFITSILAIVEVIAILYLFIAFICFVGSSVSAFISSCLLDS